MRLVFFELSIKVVFVGWSYVGKALFVLVNCDIGLQLLTWMHVAVLFNCCHLVCISLVLIFSIVHLSERLLPSSCIAIWCCDHLLNRVSYILTALRDGDLLETDVGCDIVFNQGQE